LNEKFFKKFSKNLLNIPKGNCPLDLLVARLLCIELVIPNLLLKGHTQTISRFKAHTHTDTNKKEKIKRQETIKKKSIITLTHKQRDRKNWNN